MATLYTDIASTQSASKGLHERPSNTQLTSGGLFILNAQYTTTGSETASDELLVARLPVGAIVVPQLSFVEAQSGFGSAIQLDLGEGDYLDDSADDLTLYAANLDLSAGTNFLSGGSAALAPAAITKPGWFKVGLDTVTSPGTAKVLRFGLVFTLAN